MSYTKLREEKDMQRIKCPVCKQQGVLQWKETITRIKGKEYRYKKLYVYHQHPKEHPEKPKWCYLNRDHLKALGITQNRSSLTQKLTQNNRNPENLNSSSFPRNQIVSKSRGWELNPHIAALQAAA